MIVFFPARRAWRGLLPGAGALTLGCLAMSSVGGAGAATRSVSNCNDSGNGSLRAAAALAVGGDTIDLSRLACGRITLTSGEIVLPQTSIRLLGPGRLALTLHGNRASRVLDHRGTGTLVVQRLSLSYGHVVDGAAQGGCVRSRGNVELRQSRIHHCVVEADDSLELLAYGAGISAPGYVLLDRSSVFDNHADEGSQSYGGGIFAARTILLHSQVYNNTADQGGGVMAEGFRAIYSIVQDNVARDASGGVDARGTVEVNKSTISGNRSAGCSALCVSSNPHGDDAHVVVADSTVSGNVSMAAGAIQLAAGDGAELFNSTVTANRQDAGECAGALAFRGRLRMESAIVSGNACAGSGPADIGATAPLAAPVAGSHNLVGAAGQPMPPDTLFAAPGLAPLTWNGGPTRTHAILGGSLAIDHGNNVLHRVYDQRGAPHPRVHGSRPDIGAYER